MATSKYRLKRGDEAFGKEHGVGIRTDPSWRLTRQLSLCGLDVILVPLVKVLSLNSFPPLLPPAPLWLDSFHLPTDKRKCHPKPDTPRPQRYSSLSASIPVLKISSGETLSLFGPVKSRSTVLLLSNGPFCQCALRKMEPRHTSSAQKPAAIRHALHTSLKAETEIFEFYQTHSP
ncbi:Dynein Heavy Chain 1, Axonemal [Manis pentadactyla]|nr:Dynein Heavy Chain 1, Axonemal [Manis pentadactyla]